jgi:maltoporin
METKKCTKCKTDKLETDFPFKNKSTGKRQTVCNVCQREYKNKWYHNSTDNKEKFRLTRQGTKKKLQSNMLSFLSGKCCVDCGETDIITFDFDHKDESNKEHNIGSMVRDCYSWKNILKEIEKCEIRCANCHRKRTAKQFGNYKLFNVL